MMRATSFHLHMNHLLMQADLAMMGGTHSQSATAQAKMSAYLAVMMREPLGGMCSRPAAYFATDACWVSALLTALTSPSLLRVAQTVGAFCRGKVRKKKGTAKNYFKLLEHYYMFGECLGLCHYV
jgi:hypothetical protein